MKFKVVIVTHKKPLQALTVLGAMRALESGKHKVQYVLACDAEDHTSEVLMRHEDTWNVDVDLRCRPASVQDCWNRNMTDPSEADFFLNMTDDAFCAAPDWDEFIVQGTAAAPRPDLSVMGWHDLASPNNFTLAIVTAGWLRATGEPLLDPRFDFWFSDTAIAETWSYVHGRVPPRPKYLLMAGKPGNPNPKLLKEGGDRLWDLYAKTRSDRIATAERVCKGLGLSSLPGRHLISQWVARDAEGREDTRRLVARLTRGADDLPPI